MADQPTSSTITATDFDNVNASTSTSTSTSTGTFTLLLFASARSYCSDTESLTLPAPMTLKQLLDELERRWPGVGEKVLRRGCQIVRNLEYFLDDDVDLGEVLDGKEGEGKGGKTVVGEAGDEVAVVPPVSAG